MDAPSQARGVVTGAGGGIGKAVVRRLLREGARILAVDAKAEGLAELAGADCETLVGRRHRPAVRARDRRLGGRRPLSRQLRRRHRHQTDLRADSRRLAPRADRQRRGHVLSLPESRPSACARRRDRQSLVELGQARDDDRSCGLCRFEDDDPFDHPLVRLCAGAAPRAGQRDPAGHRRHVDAGGGARREWRRCAAFRRRNGARPATRPFRSGADRRPRNARR